LHVDWPIRADARLARGTPPTQSLQRRLRRPPHLTALDRALTFVYLLWEPEPHLALGWILWRHPSRFPRAALRLAATFDATLLGYFAFPSAPPWWASEQGDRMDGEVHRVTLEVMRSLRGKPRPAADHEVGSNPWASMPSDHFASALSAAIALAEVDSRAGALGFTYALALSLALVYTGEHYVVDLLAGGALVGAVHGAAQAPRRPAGPRRRSPRSAPLAPSSPATLAAGSGFSREDRRC
jgi:membrane-associated phospholipid phosphatase